MRVRDLGAKELSFWWTHPILRLGHSSVHLPKKRILQLLDGKEDLSDRSTNLVMLKLFRLVKINLLRVNFGGHPRRIFSSPWAVQSKKVKTLIRSTSAAIPELLPASSTSMSLRMSGGFTRIFDKPHRIDMSVSPLCWDRQNQRRRHMATYVAARPHVPRLVGESSPSLGACDTHSGEHQSGNLCVYYEPPCQHIMSTKKQDNARREDIEFNALGPSFHLI